MDLTNHPCFNASARRTAVRIHLPVAPRCNVQCNYCRRDHDCVNESRPGVTSKVLTPGQALRYVEEMVKIDKRVSVVGIAGPGDPFANAAATMETLRLVRARFPEMLLCVATNGLGVGPYVEELAALKVSHVTLTVNAIDAGIGEKIYAWVRDEPRVYRGFLGAKVLLERQLAAIAALKARGITIKINTIIIPGINDAHVGEVARRMAELGADIINCVPLYPVEDTPFAAIPTPPAEQVASIRAEASRHLPIMSHCARCRADAAGLIGEQNCAETADILARCAISPLDAADDRPYVAAATREGVLVNQHLGEAMELAIFKQAGDRFERVELRSTPPPGNGRDRWLALAEILRDCRALLVASAGQAPTGVLASQNIRIIMMEGLIEEGLVAVYGNQEVRAPLRARHSCGSGCAGAGTGCL